MSEVYAGCLLVQFDKNSQPIPYARVVACDEGRGEAVIVSLRTKPFAGRKPHYIKAPRRISLLQLNDDIKSEALTVVGYEPPSHELLLPEQFEANDSSDLNRRTRRNLPRWLEKANTDYELIRPFVQGRTIHEIVFDEELPGWPSRRALELGVSKAVKIARTLNAFILGMGQMPAALLPGYAHSGAPGQQKFSSTKTGRPSEASIARGEAPDGRNCDATARVILARGWRAFRKPGVSTPQALEQTRNRYFTESISHNGPLVKVKLMPEAYDYTEAQFRYWGERADHVLEDDGKLCTLSPKKLQQEARKNHWAGRIPSYNAEAFLDSTSADQTLVSCTSRFKVVGSPWRTVLMGAVVDYIFGIHVSFENVSASTALMTVLHAAESKVDFCARFGITIKEEDWLSATFLRIPTDNGEPKGERMMTTVEAIEGGISYGPSYNALNKGPLESGHNSQHRRVDHRQPGSTMGRRKKRGEPHRAELALLNLPEYMAQLIGHILYHNNEEIIELPTVEMREAGVEPTRRGVIQWMNQNGYVSSAPKNLDTLRVKCLPTLPGVIDKDGVHLFDPTSKTPRRITRLVYRSSWLDRNVLASFKRVVAVTVNIDPSDLTRIWVNREGLRELRLITNDPDLGKLTLAECLIDGVEDRARRHKVHAVEVQAGANRTATRDGSVKGAKKDRDAEARDLRARGTMPSRSARRRGVRQNRTEEQAAMSGIPLPMDSPSAPSSEPAAGAFGATALACVVTHRAGFDPFEEIVRNSRAQRAVVALPKELS